MALKFLNNGYFAGTVGIGTDSPLGELHVKNVSELYTDLDGSDAAVNFLDNNSDVWRIGIRASDNSFRFSQDATSLGSNVRFTIADGGNVGIGTDSPGHKLQVNDGNVAITGGTTSTLFMNITTNQLYGDVNGVVILKANNNLRLNTNGAERMRIIDNGNVGIGTTNPSEKLEVAGNARITGDVTLSNGNALRWTSDDVRIEGTTAGDNIKFYVANTEILQLAQSGTLATITGNLRVTGAYYDSNNSPGTANQVLVSTVTGTDWIDPTLLPAESAEKVIQTVRFGEAVSKGDPLFITGYHGSTGPAIVERADATDATKMPAYGVAIEDYAINATGLMIAVGDFDDLDTSSYSVGDTLYVAVGGGMTNVKPTGTALIQNMGIVSRSNANNGQAEIVAIGRTNDVPNLPTGRLFVGTATNTSLISDVVYVDDANDRVGIGTASPGAKLEISKSQDTTFIITSSYNGGWATQNYGHIEFKSEDLSGTTDPRAAITGLQFSNGAYGGLGFSTHGLSGSLAEAMPVSYTHLTLPTIYSV